MDCFSWNRFELALVVEPSSPPNVWATYESHKYINHLLVIWCAAGYTSNTGPTCPFARWYSFGSRVPRWAFHPAAPFGRRFGADEGPSAHPHHCGRIATFR